ncbi:amino acid adenylation domain-containing protein [Planomonospora sp. ID67723]|uniref:non-ribosomal peptide synthetase n=1 Tax=Planomonospora sp. ID67723 TaxID=2738134 RepID=UPI0018C35CF6|nr:non-ribosomal peptide synthetase [Planomonospora sp. ID67723]MBG0832652.1 amino acid adenylation domain-containing protein [Planomonospora sp. ID67723]
MTDILREELVQARLAGIRSGRRAAIPRVPRGGPLPLSFGQRRLWVLERLDPDSGEYLVPTVMRMPPSLDPELVRGAWQALVDRHEALRTRYVVVGDEPMQVVDDTGAVDFEFRELTEDAALRWAEEASGAPFALDREWPVRVRLARLPGGDHLLVVVLHHIACDAWSNGVLGEEFGTVYTALAAGVPADLPELPVQYADYAVWQRERLTGELREQILGYWRDRLDGLPRLRLPLDRPRPPMRGGTGGTVPFHVRADVAERLRAIAKEHDATLYMVLLAAFQALIGRYCGTRDVVVGTVVCGRTRPEVDRMVGFLVNTLVVRTKWRPDADFHTLVGLTRTAVLGALDNQDLPFEQLVEELQPERDPSRMPLFDVMFGSQTDDSLRVGLDELAATQVVPDSPVAKFDLSGYVEDAADGTLLGRLEFATQIFDRSTVAGMAARYVRLLELVAADPATKVALADVFDEASVVEGRPEPDAPLVLDAFEAQVRATPAATAVAFSGGTTTYAELDARAERVARVLRGRGAGPETVVGVNLLRHEHLLPAMLGCWKAGAAYVPLDPAFPVERRRLMLADAGAAVVLAEPITDDLTGTPGLDVVSMPGIVAGPETGTETGAGQDPGTEAGAGGPITGGRRPLDPDSLAYVIYTSGSTGRPKGVMVSHGSLAGYTEHAAAYLRGDGGVPLFLSVAFDISVPALYPPLVTGRRVTMLPDDLDLAALGRALADTAPHAFIDLTPSHLELLCHQLGPADAARLAGLLVAGGQALPYAHVRSWRELDASTPIVNEYGPTEATVGCLRHPVGHPADPADGVVPVGTPIPGVVAHVVDEELQPVPPGIEGELCIAGPHLARGYLGRPGLTAERFVPAPGGGRLYRTGDLAVLSGGVLEFRGRIDDQVKIRGYRIEPGEIAAVLRDHPRVRDAAVVPREQPGGVRLVAYVAGETTFGELLAHCRGKLPEYMVPAAFVTLEALPLTPHGKLDTAALPDPDPVRAAEYRAPDTETEEIVAELWTEVLGGDPPGVHDDFFAAGGDSVSAIRMIGSIRDSFDVDVPFRTFFAGPTVAALSAAVEAAVRAEIQQMTRAELLAYGEEQA